MSARPEYERIHRKTEKREAVREKKAESAAKLEKSIESELLERLKRGTYGDIYNFAPEEFNKVLDEEAGNWCDDLMTKESEKEIEDEDLFIEDMGEDEDMEEMGDALASKKGAKAGKWVRAFAFIVDLLRVHMWSWSTRKRRRIRSWRRISVHLCVIM